MGSYCMNLLPTSAYKIKSLSHYVLIAIQYSSSCCLNLPDSLKRKFTKHYQEITHLLGANKI